jgi:thiol-disulfide isomerase/thioredoxin
MRNFFYNYHQVKLFRIYILFGIIVVFLTSCSLSDEIVVRLEPQDVQEGRGPRWSPKGEKLTLTKNDNALETTFTFGSGELNSWAIKLAKTNESIYYNTLFIDYNRDMSFDDSESINIEPSETRGKIWSSFSTSLDIAIVDPWTGKESTNVYPLSFWYVFDPAAGDDVEEVLRFSRRGWMEGTALIDGVEANVLLTESLMDGVIDTSDSWAIAPASDLNELYEYRNNRSLSNHAWLNEIAYRVIEVHPSGRIALLEAYDAGISRLEEAEKMDIYAPDKNAAHSGGVVNFLHDFSTAEELSKKADRNLFIDFETTWCGPCKLMDKLVYNADLVVAASNDLVAVKVDGDEHPDLVSRFEVTGYPTLIILSPEGEIIKKVSGYQSVVRTAGLLGTKE